MTKSSTAEFQLAPWSRTLRLAHAVVWFSTKNRTIVWMLSSGVEIARVSDRHREDAGIVPHPWRKKKPGERVRRSPGVSLGQGCNNRAVPSGARVSGAALRNSSCECALNHLLSERAVPAVTGPFRFSGIAQASRRVPFPCGVPQGISPAIEPARAVPLAVVAGRVWISQRRWVDSRVIAGVAAKESANYRRELPGGKRKIDKSKSRHEGR